MIFIVFSPQRKFLFLRVHKYIFALLYILKTNTIESHCFYRYKTHCLFGREREINVFSTHQKIFTVCFKLYMLYNE